jgi:hypothetical protein
VYEQYPAIIAANLIQDANDGLLKAYRHNPLPYYRGINFLFCTYQPPTQTWSFAESDAAGLESMMSKGFSPVQTPEPS